MPVKGLRERLADGEDVLVAEGYLFEFERRGYLQAGPFVPVVVREHPDLVRSVHEEYVHSGSDVTLAFTYYGHRAKLQRIDKEEILENLNVQALKIAREVADKTNTLMAGNICNTGVYKPDDEKAIALTESMFKEQIEWACQEGADFIVGETFQEYGEAKLALDSIQKYGQGLASVITFLPFKDDVTLDGVPYDEACRKLEEAGCDVVGLNCGRGPKTMMPIMKKIREACKGPIAALPIPHRTSPEQPSFVHLKNTVTGQNAFPRDLHSYICYRSEIEEFAREAKNLGVQYIGLCCGNCSNLFRIISEVYGRKPPACRFSPDMSKHIFHVSANDITPNHAYKEFIKEVHDGDVTKECVIS